MGQTILFVTYGGGHAQLVLSLLPFLDQLGIGYKILALTTAQRAFRSEGYPFLGCIDFLYPGKYQNASAWGERLSEAFWSPDTGVSWQETCAYMGVSMIDLIGSLGEQEANELYAKNGRAAFCPVDFMKEVLVKESPFLVVVSCLARMEKAAVIAAKSLGIKTLLIEDLFGYSLLGSYSEVSPPVLVSELCWPDLVVVMNAEVARIVASSGFPRQRIHPLGQPLFSRWFGDLNESPRFESSDQNDLPACSNLVTYASPAVLEIAVRHSRVIRDLALGFKDNSFCIKLHPSLSVSCVRERLGEIPANLVILADVNNVAVVKSSSLYIIFNSTLGVLALMSLRPLVVFDDTGKCDVLPFVSSGAAVKARSADELRAIVSDHLSNRSCVSSDFVHPLFENPPLAREDIAAFLQSLVQA